MDQKKTGEFITTLRKEKGLTQRELAERMLISDKTVSKWETGNGFPELSLMLPLCEILEITVGELLAGKRLEGAEYKKEAEKAMLSCAKDRKEAQFRLRLMFFAGIPTLVVSLALICLAGYLQISTVGRVLLIVLGCVNLIFGIATACALEFHGAIYECPDCAHRFSPSFKACLFALHIHTSRSFKCPKCGKRNICKRKLSYFDD